MRLLRRRLTISAPTPHGKIRSALPWPVRWAGIALALGFCGAFAMGAFQFGKDIAGLDSGTREELHHLRAENDELRRQRDRIQAQFNTSGARPSMPRRKG